MSRQMQVIHVPKLCTPGSFIISHIILCHFTRLDTRKKVCIRFFLYDTIAGVYGVFDFKLNFEKNQLHFYGK